MSADDPRSIRPATPTDVVTQPGLAGEARIFPVGQWLLGTYEVRDLLGEGGMGQVFEAYDHSLGRVVAVKAAWADAPPRALEMEAKALAAFRHPSLVVVHTLGEHDGVPFIVMERVYGVSLVDAMIDRAELGLRFEVAEVLDLLGAIAGGLSAVHRAGVAHRDVKPGNIMLSANRRFVLMDFGLFLPEFALESQTMVAGSPPYMAPEAIANVVAAGEGALLDIYGLGVVGYEMLTGRLPREGIELGSLKEAMAPFEDPSCFRGDIPADLEAIICEMLQTDPAARPSTAEEVEWRIRAMKPDGAVDLQTKPTVLVVDDNREVARVLGYSASKAIGECDLHYAEDGEAALRKVREITPSIMLLDLEMPNVNGLEVAMYMRGARLAERCAIIAVSAGAQESDLHALRALGVRHVVLKDEHMRRNLHEALRAVSHSPTPA